ncbi:MAG: hypothetical protein NC489_47005 [Ruminococcus flavefaciens]|nr:hypothetical protein [Ruminococcus flavefaciens]
MVKINEKMENVKENVCKFYFANKDECDKLYSYAEQKDFGKIYENISEEYAIKTLFIQTALVIITANKYEKNILHWQIYSSQKYKIKRIEIELFPQKESKAETYAYSFKWNGFSILHIEAQQTGSYTYGGSADIVRYIINNKLLYPMAIISYGVCFGTDELKYSLGNVIISKKIYPYFMGAKITDHGYFVTDDNMFKINSLLSAKIKSMIEENAFSLPNNMVYFGNYITGEAVISRQKARDEFVKAVNEPAIGGEMEGYGLLKECNSFSNFIPCLIVKSICDWAILKNFDPKPIFQKYKIKIEDNEPETIKDRLQAYAAFQAFRVVDIMLNKHLFEQSIYEKISVYIHKQNGKVLLAETIKEKIEEIAQKYLHTHLDDSFILDIINYFKANGLFDQDDIADKLNNENIWGQPFQVKIDAKNIDYTDSL